MALPRICTLIVLLWQCLPYVSQYSHRTYALIRNFSHLGLSRLVHSYGRSIFSWLRWPVTQPRSFNLRQALCLVAFQMSALHCCMLLQTSYETFNQNNYLFNYLWIRALWISMCRIRLRLLHSLAPLLLSSACTWDALARVFCSHTQNSSPKAVAEGG